MESLQKGTPLINVYKKFLARKYMVNAIKQAPVRVASRILPESIKKIIRDTEFARRLGMKLLVLHIPNTLNYGSMMMAENFFLS